MRGGDKLRAALTTFSIDVDGRVALDVGAASGGFTKALLDGGARRVYAVDVGHGQLPGSLRQDDRVVVMERTNIADVDTERVPERWTSSRSTCRICQWRRRSHNWDDFDSQALHRSSRSSTPHVRTAPTVAAARRETRRSRPRGLGRCHRCGMDGRVVLPFTRPRTPRRSRVPAARDVAAP
jgi:hypothetical protein